MTSPREHLPHMIRLAREAGVMIAEAFKRDVSVEWKGPRDPVTEVDRAVNAFLCRELAKVAPEVGLVAEETDEATNLVAQQRPTLMFIDPLDGTQEFVDRRPEFVVLLGLVVGNRPVAGVVHVPMSCETYYAVAGEGAFGIAADGSEKRLCVSARSVAEESFAVVTRTHGSPRLQKALAKLGVQKRPCGSAGLKAVRIAEGAADVWMSPGPAGMRWDVAASECLLSEAGGRMTDGLGRAFDYRNGLRNDAGILASNSLLHERAVAAMAYGEEP